VVAKQHSIGIEKSSSDQYKPSEEIHEEIKTGQEEAGLWIAQDGRQGSHGRGEGARKQETERKMDR
jgi:hypothetical protein